MRSLSHSSNRPKPLMNVTPLVDVVLVLLIIFMVIVPMMDKTPIDLPSIVHVDPDPKGKTDPFTLSLATDGKMYFESELLDEQSFKKRLTQAYQDEPNRNLILRADQSATYGVVRKLFKTCQEIGIPGISLRVNERKTDKLAGTR